MPRKTKEQIIEESVDQLTEAVEREKLVMHKKVITELYTELNRKDFKRAVEILCMGVDKQRELFKTGEDIILTMRKCIGKVMMTYRCGYIF